MIYFILVTTCTNFKNDVYRFWTNSVLLGFCANILQKSILKIGVPAILFLFIAIATNAQTQVRMSLSNPVQISEHAFEFDVFIRNTGTTVLALRDYAFGIDHAPGLANGGTLSYSYIAGSRDSAFSSISGLSTAYTPSNYHFRLTTATNSSTTTPANLPLGVPMKLGRMRVNNTASFPPCFQPNLSLHVLFGTGFTQCIASCYLPPNNVNPFSIIGVGNSSAPANILGLIGENLPTVFTLIVCPTPITSTTQINACNSYTWPITGLTYTASGQYSHNTITNCTCFNTEVIDLAIHTPTSSTQTITAASSYTWAANGATYNSTGIYTTTLTNSVGCDSTLTLNLTITSSQPGTILTVHCFIAGYWAGNNLMSPVLANQGIPALSTTCDSITVQLRSTTSTSTVIASINTVIKRDGNIDCLFPAISGQYYIVIKHRNAVETWSAIPVTVGSTPAVYNFSNAANKAYGSNMTLVAPGVWAFYSGDIYKDDNIDLIDLVNVEMAIYNFSYGYISTDLNGDGNVDLLDAPSLEVNIENYIFVMHP